jgi:hypothetical protein
VASPLAAGRRLDRGPGRGACAAAVLSTALAVALSGCREEPRAWERTDGAPPTAASFVPSPALPDASALADAGDDAGSLLGDEPVLPVRVGGPWVRCYGNFRVSGEPVKDVTRLSLLCGPENGMHRMGDTLVGALAEGEAKSAGTFRVVHGECYRVFAVAEPSVTDLDVAVQSSHGANVATDQSEDGWPIVQADRPFCPLDDDTYTLELTARRGHGRFAVEVWRLHTPDRTAKKGRPG